MIKIELNLPGFEHDYATISNQELIKSIREMPEDEYNEIIKGIMVNGKITTNNLMVMFAHLGKLLLNEPLNPAQKQSIIQFINNFNQQI